MFKKSKTLVISLFSLMALASCGQAKPSIDDNNNYFDENGNLINSPSYDEGLGGNADKDVYEEEGIEELSTLLKKVQSITSFSYNVKNNVSNANLESTQYFTPNAWYEDNISEPEKSFGYAQNLNKEMFKYYLYNDKIIPSVFEYGGYGVGDEMTRTSPLYGPFTIAHIDLLKDVLYEKNESGVNVMKTDYATNLGGNRFLITDSLVSNIFMYLTTYGGSVVQNATSTVVQILDAKSYKFSVDITLGNYGNIVSTFSPLSETPIDKVNEMALSGKLDGVAFHQDVKDLFKLIDTNNYVLEGIKTNDDYDNFTRRIHCTNNYFYTEDVSSRPIKNGNWGYAFIDKNKEVTVHEITTNRETYEVSLTGKTSVEKPKDYNSCFEFSDIDDDLYFTLFKGPIESGDMKYILVDKLPEVGEKNVFYIVKSENIVYEWKETVNGQFEFKRYSQWYDSVGDFYINDISATYYLSSTPITALGHHFYEQDFENENLYRVSNVDILTFLANGLFGYGFQPTTTWMEYIQDGFIEIHKDENQNIVSADIGLNVLATVDGQQGVQKIYYTIKDFGKGNIDRVDTFLKDYMA